jgi:hypothetical protein
MTREILPMRRECDTFPVQFETLHGTISMLASVGFFPDGRPAEVFVSGNKVGSAVESLARDAAIVLSIALQHGTPLDTIKNAITRNPDSAPSTMFGALVDRMAELSVP